MYCIIVDMDDTLYPLSLGLNLACRKNIEGTNMKYISICIDDHSVERKNKCTTMYMCFCIIVMDMNI